MDGVWPKGLTWDKSEGCCCRCRWHGDSVRSERNADGVSKHRKEKRERRWTWTRTERTELVIGLTVIYYGYGRIYTMKACSLPAESMLHQVHWSVHARAACCADYVQMVGWSL